MSEYATGADSKPVAGSDAVFDLVIIGSGAGSVPAALVALRSGRTAVILEKHSLVGGSTAMSGGVLWIPNNTLMRRAGSADSPAEAAEYFNACAGELTPASSAARRAAFLREAPQAIDFLQQHGLDLLYPDGYSDYHEGLRPGGKARGRALVAPVFDARKLGAWRQRLRRGALPPMRLDEAPALLLAGRTLGSKLAMARLALRLLRNRFGSDLVGGGAALFGRLLEIALRCSVPIWTESRVKSLLVEERRVVGVTVEHGDRTQRIRARAAVLVDAGGFAHNLSMRQHYQPAPASADWTHSNPGDTGEVIRMAQEAGAALAAMDQSWWVPSSITPDGVKFMHTAEMQKPHCIMVDASGSRFVNEATDYVVVGNSMYARHRTSAAVPSWLIMDNQHRSRYAWAGQRPGKTPRHWIDKGYFVVADSLPQLAERCGIDSAGLAAQVERFNRYAAAGRDEEFGRGISAWDRYFGDPTCKPNPSLGAISQAPLYAVRIYPGDVGTSGGILTDEYARTLRPDGRVLGGLYATGNATANVMGRAYPGAGASIAPAVVFGWIAARHALGLENAALQSATGILSIGSRGASRA
jgi:3-oxosteroid 1-dehydrogenase